MRPVAGLLLVLIGGAADWPNFGGPHRDNASRETGLLKEWPKDGPPRLWLRSDLGSGYSAPAVVGDRLYLMAGDGTDEHLYALDVATGKTVWSAKVGPVYTNDYGDGPRGTPTVHDGRVYALGGRGDLLCADAATGKPLWSASLVELGGEVPGWGYSESPLADGGRVVVTPGGKRGTLAAFDAATGKVQWRTEGLTDPAMYTALAVAEVGGAKQYVGATREHLFGVAPADGKVLWQVPFGSSVVVAQTPVVVGDRVYVTASGGTGSRCYRLAAPDRAEKVFANKVMLNLPGGVAAFDGHVYGYSDGRGWTCQSLRTGDEVWAAKEFPKGALTVADGRLILLTEDAGTVALAKASPDDFEITSRFTLAPQSKKQPANARVWTVPVVADGRLYLRDQEHLSCYDLRAGR